MSAEHLAQGVVVLLVSFQNHDADRPWAKRHPSTRRAQAAVVEGRRLLTSAQMVSGATLVEVEREGRPPRALARVVHQDQELNLALLEVDDPEVLADLVPLPLAPATPTTGTLRTARWREQQLEIATIRPSRMTVAESWYGRLRHAFLLGRTDVVGGGWAEPVIDADGALVGLTTSQDEHSAWVLPIELITPYLRRATAALDGTRPDPGVPALTFGWQWTTDRPLARWLGLAEPRGVMVRTVPRGTTGDGVLKPRDVLVRLDGHEVDPRGYYRHPRWGWLEFTHLAVEDHAVGDVVPATVVRGGEELEVALTLRPCLTALDRAPVRRGDDPPPYAILGGLVFLELDGDYLRTWGDEWRNRAPIRLVAPLQLLEGTQTPTERRVVVLAQALPCAFTRGYERCRDLLVASVDGAPVASLEEVVTRFAEAPGPFVRVGFHPNAERSELVLDRATLEEATAHVLAAYGIPEAVRLSTTALPPLD